MWFEKYLYVAMSDGRNITHRMHVYETTGGVLGPWKELGPLKTPDDRWAIDMSFAEIASPLGPKWYAIWSGWEDAVDAQNADVFEKVIPQHLYIAECLSPTEIGPRHLLASPAEDWNSSVASILEGPQALVINGIFRGIVVTGNASWTDRYATNILRYAGGDPLRQASWQMAEKPLFKDGYGIGHGMFVQDTELYYVGHRKTRRTHGWEDRAVFSCPVDRFALQQYLQEPKL
jgi:GH43 family beta-xylosidase